MKLEKGIVQVYTGEGKGKTTAACGLAIRAAGNGLKVCFFQFFKKPISGELKVLKRDKNIEIHSILPSYQSSRHLSKGEFLSFKKKLMKEWKYVCKNVKSEKFDVVILDEILIAIRDKFLPEEEIIKLMKSKPERVELIITGRGMTENIEKNADLVTEMRLIKHPFPEIKARKGIEF